MRRVVRGELADCPTHQLRWRQRGGFSQREAHPHPLDCVQEAGCLTGQRATDPADATLGHPRDRRHCEGRTPSAHIEHTGWDPMMPSSYRSRVSVGDSLSSRLPFELQLHARLRSRRHLRVARRKGQVERGCRSPRTNNGKGTAWTLPPPRALPHVCLPYPLMPDVTKVEMICFWAKA